jgi:hypothetical protein
MSSVPLFCGRTIERLDDLDVGGQQLAGVEGESGEPAAEVVLARRVVCESWPEHPAGRALFAGRAEELDGEPDAPTALPAKRGVAFLEPETLEDRLDPLVGRGVALHEGHAQAEVDIRGADVRLDPGVENRHQQSRDEGTDEHDVGRHEPESTHEVGGFGHQRLGEIRVVACDVLSVRLVQGPAP